MNIENPIITFLRGEKFLSKKLLAFLEERKTRFATHYCSFRLHLNDSKDSFGEENMSKIRH